MIEQAGEDRVLFLNTRPQEYVEMKFPEYVIPRMWHTRLWEEEIQAETKAKQCK
jgi:hypothetical protein